MSLIVNTTNNIIEIKNSKLKIIATNRSNIISSNVVGIQGSSGNLVVSSSNANKILTNNGTSIQWVDAPNNLTLNGGYF